jgi:nitrate/nitrite transporter NarK
MRVVWLAALVVVCAYCGYKGLDNYSLYAFEVLGFDEVSAARFTAVGAALRPIAAVVAGLAADRAGVARTIAAAFAVLVTGYAFLGLPQSSQLVWLVYADLALTMFAVFALRGVYFALLEETHVPHELTGAAVGLVSLVGFTPDVFFASIAGRLLDATPGAGGHRHYFVLLAVIAAVGMATALRLARLRGRRMTDRA